MGNHRLPFNPEQGEPADRAHTLASAGPIHAFALLDAAMREHDRPAADAARRELRRQGYDVRPLGSPPKAVRR